MKRWMVPAGAALLFLAAAVLLWPGRRNAPEPEGSGTAGEERLSVCLVGGAGAGVYDPSLLEEAAGAGAYVCCLDQGEPVDLAEAVRRALEEGGAGQIVLSLSLDCAGPWQGESRERYEETGAFLPGDADAAHIGDLAAYEEKTAFSDPEPVQLTEIGQLAEAVGEIRSLCQSAGAELTVLMEPVGPHRASAYQKAEVRELYEALAEQVDFWDFSADAPCGDSRFFYPDSSIRPALAEMMLRRALGLGGYVPEDFGVLVTAENAGDRADRFGTGGLGEGQQVTVLMYHHLSQEGGSEVNLPVSLFEEQLRALRDAGCTAVTLEDLYAYVEQGTPLPEKAVLITFDDGYESNYDLAWPLLEKYGMKGTIFAIGVSVGKDTYKGTSCPMKAHFTYEQAREMMDSGVISVQTHTYDMHQWPPYEEGPAREGAVPLEGESQADYEAAVRADLKRAREEMEAATGYPVTALSYPNGLYTPASQRICLELGFRATFTIEPRTNTVVKGLPQSLYGMGRYNVGPMTGQELLALTGLDG